MTWILDLYRSPSAFRTDPMGYLRNQTGHAYLVGGVLTLLLTWICTLIPWVPTWFGLAVVLVGYITWEAGQFYAWKADPDDCLEDIGHVAIIALAVFTGVYVLALVQAAFMASGYLWRRREVDLAETTYGI